MDEMLYDEQDLIDSYDRIEALDYHQQVEVEGIRFTAYNAGHVLGAAMFLVEIASVKVVGKIAMKHETLLSFYYYELEIYCGAE